MADIRINSLPSTATSFNTDDYIPIDGASGGTRKMLAATLPLTDVKFGGASGPSAKSSIAARAARQGLVFDGTNYCQISPSVPAAGTSDFTVTAVVNTDLSVDIQGIIGTNTAGGFGLFSFSTGALAVQNVGVGTVGVSTGLVTANKASFVAYVRSGTTGTFYINGVSAGTITDGTNYNQVNNLVGTVAGLNLFKGSILAPTFYNRALSAAEVVSLYESGVPSGADYPTQVAGTALISGDSSTFTGGVGSWTAWSGGTVTAGSGAGTFTAPGGANTAAYLNVAGNLKYGFKYRIKLDISTLTGGNLLISDTTSGATWATFTATGSNQTAEFTINQTTNGYIGIRFSANAASAVIDNITLVPLGLLLAPDAAQAGGGLTWYDTSGNAANITLPASGVTWNVPSSLKLGGNWTVGGNLTTGLGTTYVVSALNRGTTAQSGLMQWQTAGASNWSVGSGATGTNTNLEFYNHNTASTNLLLNYSTGNVLVGTTTDGGQKLQVAGTGYISGNTRVGDATGTKLLEIAGSNSVSGAGAALALVAGSTYFGYIGRASYITSGSRNTNDVGYLADTGLGHYFYTNGGTLALTLDSSQRCILSGALRLNNAYTAGAPTATGYVTIQDSVGNTYKVLVGT